MLPTNEAGVAVIRADKPYVLMDEKHSPYKAYKDSKEHQYQHIYITSPTEKIKEGWAIWRDDFVYLKDGKLANTTVHPKVGDIQKIIATTNSALTQQDDEYTASKNLAKIPQAFIEAYIKAYNEGKPITEVLLEMEQHWEKVNDKWPKYQQFRVKTRQDNTVITHPVKERVFTKSEVLSILQFSKKNYFKDKKVEFILSEFESGLFEE